MDLSRHLKTTATPQTEPIPLRTDMVENSEGGYVFTVDDWKRLDRFLILGTEGGTYYASEKALTLENAQALIPLIKAEGLRVVERAVEVSDKGLALKNEPALLVLALCVKCGDEKTRAAAYAALPKVARIPTHLFQFIEACKAMGHIGGRGMKRAITRWYARYETADDLAYHAVKYQSRGGWSHKDVLRLVKPGAKAVRKDRTPEQDAVYTWMTKGGAAAGTSLAGELPGVIMGFELAKQLPEKPDKDSTARLISLIRDYRLPREALPTAYLNEPSVWEVMLPTMPMTAMIRNLGKMGAVGLLAPLSEASRMVVSALGNETILKKARVHPLQLLVAQAVYRQGHGVKGDLKWKVDPRISDALEEAFYASFGLIEPTGKKHYLAIDVSCSMSHPMPGLVLSCAEGAAAMAMVAARTEPDYFVGAFNSGIQKVDITAKSSLQQVLSQTRNINTGGTDCSLPMLDAIHNEFPVDVFVVYTDSETYMGKMHPVQALDRYKQKSGIDAKLIVVGMTSNGFTIADPKRSDNLDVVGFSTDTPAAMAAFVRS